MFLLLRNENFDNTIVRGLLLRRPSIDIVRVQDVGLLDQDSPIVEDILMVNDCSLEGEFSGLTLPMRRRAMKPIDNTREWVLTHFSY